MRDAVDSPTPTVLRIGKFRFYFFSNERQEPPHIHVKAGPDEAKFWLDPTELAANYGFSSRELNEIGKMVEQNEQLFLRLGMSTLVNSPKSARAFVPTTALAKFVRFDEEMMHVSLTDGRLISVPTIWFPLLRNATPDQRNDYEIGGGGTSIHWPGLDEDLSVAGLLAGVDENAA